MSPEQRQALIAKRNEALKKLQAGDKSQQSIVRECNTQLKETKDTLYDKWNGEGLK